MEMESGKLFIGGISWDTTEDRLSNYFQNFGDVSEAVVMKDRVTGRARGFGFVVFADPAIAERVVMEKHIIDGRIVEAKKAVPRDYQNIMYRNNTNAGGSPGPPRTNKIFVGGLPSTVTENDFKKYFEQFGTITDVVVMYDHNTHRPRGFGFISYDSEEAVQKVLYKTFHELNGKMVEVKKAVPKELSPKTGRNQLAASNFSIGRDHIFPNIYNQGFKPGPVGGYRLRTESRYFPATTGDNCSLFSTDFGMGQDYSIFGDSANLRSPSHNGNSNRHGSASPNGYSIGDNSLIGLSAQNSWGNQNYDYLTNYLHLRALSGSGSVNTEVEFPSKLGDVWDSSNSGRGRAAGSSIYDSENLNNEFFNKAFCSASLDIQRSDRTRNAVESFYEDAFSYGDPTWGMSIPGLNPSDPYIVHSEFAASTVMSRNSVDYVRCYDVADRESDREIAT